jgi:hypothetical protein
MDKMIAEPIALMEIEPQIVDHHIVIPHGMTPIFLHWFQGKPTAYVEGWTVAKEYNPNSYDLYPLNNAHHFILSTKSNGEQLDQDWYANFGESTKEAMKDGSGNLVIRARLNIDCN